MNKFLRRFLQLFGIIAGILIVFFAPSCSDLPTSFVAPIFNTGLTFPLLDSVVTVDNMLQDTSLLQKDGLGNLILIQRATIAPNNVGDSLKLKQMSVSYQSSINDQTSILENVTLWKKPQISINSLYPSLPLPPAVSIIPPLPANGLYAEVPILPPDQVEYANFQTAAMTIVVENRMPIDMEIYPLPGRTDQGFIISTPGQNDIFVPLNDVQRMIPKGQTRGDTNSAGGEIVVQIANQLLSQDSRIKVAFRSPGSSGAQAAYDNGSVLRFTLRFKNVKLHQAKLAFGSRTLRFRVEVPFVDNAVLTQAEINALAVNLLSNNAFPISGKATMYLPQLHRIPDNASLTYNFTIRKKQTDGIVFSNGSDHYKALPDSIDLAKNGGKITALHFFIDLVTDSIPINAKEIFDEKDFYGIQGTITKLQFKSAQGTSLPATEVHISSQTEFKMQGNLNKITFNQLLAQSSSVQIRLLNTAAIQATLSGTVYLLGKNGNIITTVPISNQVIQPAIISNGKTIPVETQLDIPLGALSIPEFPKSSRMDAVVKTISNTPFFISDTDYFGGTAEVHIPLTINVSGGNFHNAALVNIPSGIADREKNITSATLTIEAKNRIPADVNCFLNFFDAKNNIILRLPKKDSLAFPSAHFNLNGIADGETKMSYALTLDSNDVAIIIKSSSYTIDLNFDAKNTNPTNPYIKFFTSDYIHIRSTLEFKGNTNGK